MKTTTNTTTRNASVMLRAWDIRRAAASEIGCKVSEVLWSACLRMAWAEAEGANAERNAARVVSAWAALSEGEQIAFMKKCIHKAAKDRIKYSTEDHYLQFSEVPAFGLYGLHDLDEFVSETWLRLSVKLADADKLTKRNERRAAQGKRPLTLVKLVYEAADASIAAIFYQDTKHSAASVRELETEDGETVSAVESICAAADDTERAAILKADVASFRNGCDEINDRILELVGRGYTEREIAADIGTISNVAVHKRIVKMREQLTALHM
jgi:hypothetical protein